MTFICAVAVGSSLFDLGAAFVTDSHNILGQRGEFNHIFLIDSNLNVESFSRSKVRHKIPAVCFPQAVLLEIDASLRQYYQKYMLPLGNIVRKHGIHFHYADDTQLYLSVNLDGTHQLVILQTCLKDMKIWMSCKSLLLNIDRTEVLSLFGLQILEIWCITRYLLWMF